MSYGTFMLFLQDRQWQGNDDRQVNKCQVKSGIYTAQPNTT